MATGSPAKSSRPPIGNYEILAHVATGGMGAVYKAMDTRLGREVALKVLLPDQAAQKPLLLKRFRLEARYGGQLSHENIVTLYEYGETQGIHFLALEYVNGTSLYDYVAQKGTLEVEESRHIIIQAIRALTISTSMASFTAISNRPIFWSLSERGCRSSSSSTWGSPAASMTADPA